MLASMKDGAILINVSRGKPADPTNPLLARPQAPITPHIAGATDVMLDGTLDYSARVSDDLTVGKKTALGSQRARESSAETVIDCPFVLESDETELRDAR